MPPLLCACGGEAWGSGVSRETAPQATKRARSPARQPPCSGSGALGEPGKVGLGDVIGSLELLPLQVGGTYWMESWEARQKSGRMLGFLPD